jgi:hypothetical protein
LIWNGAVFDRSYSQWLSRSDSTDPISREGLPRPIEMRKKRLQRMIPSVFMSSYDQRQVGQRLVGDERVDLDRQASRCAHSTARSVMANVPGDPTERVMASGVRAVDAEGHRLDAGRLQRRQAFGRHVGRDGRGE